MRRRSLEQAKWLVQRALVHFRAEIAILLYHRVFEPQSDPQLLCVSPKHFAEHLECLRHYYRVLSLKELSEALRDRQLPKRGVAVTFDDGYADNLCNAKPLLERYDIPATVFVTSGYIAQEREFWWDELERLLLHPGVLPESIRLTISGNAYQRDLGKAAQYSEEDFERNCRWNVLKKGAPSPRQDIYRSLCQLLRPLPNGVRLKVLDDLLILANARTMVRPTHRILSPDEVIRLAKEGLVEIGTHGVTHSVLSTLPLAAQRDEIQGSKVRLEVILGRPVTSFSYPYGALSDYTVDTVNLVREAGFVCACSNFAKAIRRGADFYQMPRFLVRDWDGDEFMRHLKGWFGD